MDITHRAAHINVSPGFAGDNYIFGEFDET
jgi:hypothetical protein